MTATILVEILGTLRQGAFTPAHPTSGMRLEPPGFVIGSRPRPGTALVLDDGTVSREHARVWTEAGQWHIQDLDSDNGLFLLRTAETPISPGRSLQGDHVREAVVAPSVTVALGAVVLRLTVAHPGSPGER
jgi:hypothetical protein